MSFSSMVSPSRVENPRFQSPLYIPYIDGPNHQLGYLRKPLNRMNLDLDQLCFKTVINSNTGDNSNLVTHHKNSNSYNNQQLDGGSSTVNNATSPPLSSSASSSSPPAFNFNNETSVQTTLEDFLMRHGGFDVDVVNPQPLTTINPIAATSHPTDWSQYQLVNVQEQHRQHDAHVTASLCANSIVEGAYSNDQLVASMPMVVAALPPGIQTTTTSDKKRKFSDEMMEKTIERRQKRMIKNRESAARSRQRKQDYTNGLEHKVALLRKENQMLRKEKEQVELFPFQPLTPKSQLRRTSSAKF